MKSAAKKNLRYFSLLGLGLLVGLTLTGCLVNEAGPHALFTVSPAQHLIPFTAEFDGALSYSASGDIVAYEWDFGDGTHENGAQVEHEFTDSGDYVVELTVIDEAGQSGTSSFTVHALNPLPSPSFIYYPRFMLNGKYTVGAGEEITLDASASTDDGEIVAYEWNFGDGNTATTSEDTIAHSFLWPSDLYIIILTVIDDDGGQASCEDTVTVVGSEPCQEASS